MNYIKTILYIIYNNKNKMTIITNPEFFRKNICEKIKGIIDSEKDSIAINLEKGIYNFAIKEANSRKIIKKWENQFFVQLYIDRLRTIYINLQNPELLRQLQMNEISPQTLAFMTHQ